MTSPLQRKLKITGPTVITANRLADGVVVWFDQAGGWTTALAEAKVVTTSEEALALLDKANADENHAVGAYPARVALDAAGAPSPMNLRERIRVEGPTIAIPGAA